MSDPHTIVLVDDDPGHLRLMSRWLEREGYTTHEFETGEAFLDALPTVLPDVVLLDLNLGRESSGLDVLAELRRRDALVPVVMLTASTELEDVVSAMQAGAWDYLTKPVSRTRLVTSMRNAVAQSTMTVRLKQLEREATQPGFGGMIGTSPPMQTLFRSLDRIASSDVTVLVHGESGTGKELVARALHENSPRAGGPFVAINCAAIPATLQESELFGHEKGAFTGADQQRKGRFEQAHRGTLFLDEVAELSPELQASLLRALQERRFFRVGGNTEIGVDVRIVAASHKELEQVVAAGDFREDLFYRLAVLELEVPPLRARGDDILLLAEHLLAESCARHGGGPLTLGPATRAVLRAYPWPGNVRELGNAMEAASVKATDVVEPEHLPRRVRGSAAHAPAPTPEPSEPAPAGAASNLRAIEQIERDAIARALADADGNVSEVIRALGIPRTTLYRKLAKYGLR